jgi:hypothetical protein
LSRGIKIALVIVVGLMLLGVSFIYVAQRVLIAQFVDPALEKMEADPPRYIDRFEADMKALRAHPFFAMKRAGGDAGPFLNPRIHWTGDDELLSGWRAAVAAPAAERIEPPGGVREVLAGFPELADEKRAVALANAADFEWMREARHHAYWSLHPKSPVAAMAELRWVDAPIPSYIDLGDLVQLRLVHGRATGDLDAALEDVRHLAWLAFTNENLISQMIGIAWLNMADKAVTAWSPEERRPLFSDEERAQIKRAFWAANGFFTGTSTPEMMDRAVAAGAGLPGLCAGITEAAALELALGPLLVDRLGVAHGKLREVVRGGVDGCRLGFAKRFVDAYAPPAWDQQACLDFLNDMEGAGAGEEAELGWVRQTTWVPGTPETIGLILYSIARPNAFAKYDEADESQRAPSSSSGSADKP